MTNYVYANCEYRTLEGQLLLTSLEAGDILKCRRNNVIRSLEARGFEPVGLAPHGKGFTKLWLESDVLTAVRVIKPRKTSGRVAREPHVGRAYKEWVRTYGLPPHELPDLILAWCELLDSKRLHMGAV